MYDSQAVTEAIEWPALPDTEPQPGFGARRSQSKHISMKADRSMGAYRLRLYVAGETAISQKARENLKHLSARCAAPIETIVIDVLSEPAIAEKARVLATPTLVYEHPARSKRVIGDLSDVEKVIEFLGLQQRGEGL